MDMTTRHFVRQDAHDQLAADMAAYLASGGEIEQIPRGAMVEAGWTGKDKLTKGLTAQTMARKERAEAEARERQEAQERERAAKAAQKAAAKVRQPQRVRPETLELLAAMDELDTITALAERLGRSRTAVWLVLDRLRGKGWVTSKGKQRQHTTWHKTAKCPSSAT